MIMIVFFQSSYHLNSRLIVSEMPYVLDFILKLNEGKMFEGGNKTRLAKQWFFLLCSPLVYV